jgi:hypothetical protein
LRLSDVARHLIITISLNACLELGDGLIELQTKILMRKCRMKGSVGDTSFLASWYIRLLYKLFTIFTWQELRDLFRSSTIGIVKTNLQVYKPIKGM